MQYLMFGFKPDIQHTWQINGEICSLFIKLLLPIKVLHPFLSTEVNDVRPSAAPLGSTIAVFGPHQYRYSSFYDNSYNSIIGHVSLGSTTLDVERENSATF